MLLSLGKLQRSQEPCVRRWGRRVHTRTNDPPAPLSTGVLGTLYQQPGTETNIYFLLFINYCVLFYARHFTLFPLILTAARICSVKLLSPLYHEWNSGLRKKVSPQLGLWGADLTLAAGPWWAHFHGAPASDHSITTQLWHSEKERGHSAVHLGTDTNKTTVRPPTRPSSALPCQHESAASLPDGG